MGTHFRCRVPGCRKVRSRRARVLPGRMTHGGSGVPIVNYRSFHPVLMSVPRHRRTDMIMLTPLMSAMADMVPDNPGIWLFRCHMPGHFTGGMYARFTVQPAVTR